MECGEAEVDRVQDTVGDERFILLHEIIYQPVQGGHIGVLFRDQDGNCRGLIGDPGAAFMQAEQVIGARVCAAQQFLVVQGIDADRVTFPVQRLHGLFQVRERGIRQTAYVNHVGAVPLVPCGPGQDFIHADLRSLHDLRKNAHTVIVQADCLCLTPEKNRQVLDVHGAALHRHAQGLA